MALLMGTHARLGVASPVLLLEDNILCLIHSFVKTAPIWSGLERAVEQAGLHCVGEDFSEWDEDDDEAYLSPAELVHQYRAFLALKIFEEDWRSETISPPMIEFMGRRLVDEVWHVHLSMDCYVEDCRLLTGGHVIEHQPVLGSEAKERYEHTYELHCSRCEELNEEVDERCWPEPPTSDASSASSWDGYIDGNGGCC